MRQVRAGSRWTPLLPAAIALGLLAWEAPHGWAGIGPGTSGIRIPASFKTQSFTSVKQGAKQAPLSLDPSIRTAIGLSQDPEGGPTHDPVEFDLRLATEDDTEAGWMEGEIHTILLNWRSCSIRFIRTPPEAELFIVGPAGVGLEIGNRHVGEESFEWTVPPLPRGVYRVLAFDRSTGMSRASEFAFLITSATTALATPTPTGTSAPSATPTLSPTGTSSETSTPTATRDYDIAPHPRDGWINAKDLLDLIRSATEEQGILFDFSRFWDQASGLPHPD
jgi:hypothetical protein